MRGDYLLRILALFLLVISISMARTFPITDDSSSSSDDDEGNAMN